MAEQWVPTLGEQMLAADEERRRSMSGSDRAAGQMGDLFSLAFPSLQTISKANAIKGVIRPLKERGLLKANLPAVKTISKDIVMTPQSQLDKIDTVGKFADSPNMVGQATPTDMIGKIDKLGNVTYKAPTSIDVSISPNYINQAAKTGTWHHEAGAHVGVFRPNPVDEQLAADMLNKTYWTNKLQPVASNWMANPVEQHAVAMQSLIRDPEILKQLLTEGGGKEMSGKLYNTLFTESLKRALASKSMTETPPNLVEAFKKLLQGR